MEVMSQVIFIFKIKFFIWKNFRIRFENTLEAFRKAKYDFYDK